MITDDKESANIPEDYEETTIQINGKVFPAWQNVVDTKLADFCLVYAVDNAGKKGLYQYDSTQKTYQRFLPPTAEKEKQDGSVANKVTTFVEENLPKIMVGAWGVFLMMLLLIVILAVKLRHRMKNWMIITIRNMTKIRVQREGSRQRIMMSPTTMTMITKRIMTSLTKMTMITKKTMSRKMLMMIC